MKERKRDGGGKRGRSHNSLSPGLSTLVRAWALGLSMLTYTDACPGALYLGLLTLIFFRAVIEHLRMSLAGGWYPLWGAWAGGGLPNGQQICWLAASNRKGISSRGPTSPAALQVVFLDKG